MKTTPKKPPIKKTTPKKRGEYDKPLKVEGSFLDIMKASVKNANDNSAPKKEE